MNYSNDKHWHNLWIVWYGSMESTNNQPCWFKPGRTQARGRVWEESERVRNTEPRQILEKQRLQNLQEKDYSRRARERPRQQVWALCVWLPGNDGARSKAGAWCLSMGCYICPPGEMEPVTHFKHRYISHSPCKKHMAFWNLLFRKSLKGLYVQRSGWCEGNGQVAPLVTLWLGRVRTEAVNEGWKRVGCGGHLRGAVGLFSQDAVSLQWARKE